MASAAMSSLLNKLTGKLLKEVSLFHEVEDRVWSLVCMLKKLRPFVMEVQRLKEGKEMEGRQRIIEFIELVNDADDVIDAYIITTLTTLSHRTENISVISMDKDVHLKAVLRSQIESIKLKFKKWHNHCLTSLSSSSSPSIIENNHDDMVVGMGTKVKKMIERLKDKDPRRDFIPIVGPGGIGKTTLAREVYKHSTVLEIFPCRAWICAHNNYELPMENLLREIFNQLGLEEEDHRGHNDEMILITNLTHQIYKHLKTCERFLLVFDDVCTTQFLDDINIIFPDIKRGGGAGDRIIFTTRYDEVALYANPRSPPFYLRPSLTMEESWDLFSTRIVSSSFRDEASTSTISEGVPPSHSQVEPNHHPWKKLVEACGGLPLAIIALAEEYPRLLKWSEPQPPPPPPPPSVGNIRREDNYGNDNDDRDQKFPEGIWVLIYENLPHHLKPCLLYLGVLNSCRSTQIKELMLAEDLMQTPNRANRRQQTTVVEESKDYDTIGEEYLNELINRNLVQVQTYRSDRGIKEISILKQTINFCRDKATKENFLQFIAGNSQTFPQDANRIAIQGWNMNQFTPSMKARCFMILKDTNPCERIFGSEDWSSLFGKCNSLRVLDLDVVLKERIPSEIDNLVHLIYLRLNYKGFEGTILPPSICNLWNLQFIRIMNNQNPWSVSSAIPLDMFWKMKRLKRLLYNGRLHLPQPPEDSAGRGRGRGGGCGGGGDGGALVLDNLQGLKYVSVRSCTKQVFSRMPNLVRLSMGGVIQQKHIVEISNCLPSLKHLQRLGLQGAATNKTISLPRWEMFPPNITHLTLNQTRLVGEPMRILAKLPKLQVLKLEFNAVDEDNLNVDYVTDDHGHDGFLQLKYLKLEEMHITKWTLSVGAMPRLETVVLRNCTSLLNLPSQALQEIDTLKELEIHNYSYKQVETAAVGIQENFGKDRFKLDLIRNKSFWISIE